MMMESYEIAYDYHSTHDSPPLFHLNQQGNNTHCPGNIHIMFFNCQGASSQKFNILQQQLDEKFDIIIIAETWNCDEKIRKSFPIFFASTVERYQSITHNPGGIMVIATMKIKPQMTILFSDQHSLIFSVHDKIISAMYLPPSMNDGAVISILENAKQFNTDILIGDINTNFGKLMGNTRSTNASRSKIFLNYRDKNEMILHHPAIGKPGVDHIFTKQNIICTYDYLKHQLIKSDHSYMDIKLTVSFNQRETFTVPRYRLAPLSNDPGIVHDLCSFYNEISPPFLPSINHFSSIPAPEAQEIIDTVYNIISDAIKFSAEAVLGTYPDTPSIASLQPSKLPSHTTTYNETLKAIKLASKAISRPIASRSPSKMPTEDAVDFFSDLFSRDKNSPPTPSLPCHEKNLPIATIAAFSEYEIRDFIKKYPSKKSGGIDGIHIRLIKALMDSQLPSHLHQLFQFCLHSGLTPSTWNISLIYPIMKKQNENTINTCRPISLTIMTRRIFEGLLLRHINKLHQYLNTFHPLQCGFKQKSDTLFHSLIAHEAAIRFHPIHIFYDFANAYDKVDINILLRKLIEKKIPAFIIHLVRSLFLKTHSRIAVNNHISEQFNRGRGLFQGSLLSPMLFNFFIDDLAEEIIPKSQYITYNHPFPPIQLFADDIKTAALTIEDAKVYHEKIISWSNRNLMTLNVSKCGIVGFEKNTHFKINEQLIPCVPFYRYLGIPLTKYGIDIPQLKTNFIEKAERAINLLKATAFDCSVLTKLSLYKSFSRSTLDFSLPFIWGQSASFSSEEITKIWDPIERIQHRFLTWIFPTRMTVKYRNINLSLMGLPTIRFRAETLSLNFIRRIYQQNPDSPIFKLLTQCTKFTIPFNNTTQFKKPIITNLRTHHLLSSIPITIAPTEYKRKITNQYQNHLKNPLNAKGANLCVNIDPSCRHRQILYDSGIREQKISTFVISWRRNTWHFGDNLRRTCPNCSDPNRHAPEDHWFRRSCVDKCDLLNTCNWGHLKEKYLLYQNQYKSLTSSPAIPFIDFLLNNRQYEIIYKISKHLHQIVPLIDFEFSNSTQQTPTKKIIARSDTLSVSTQQPSSTQPTRKNKSKQQPQNRSILEFFPKPP